MSPVSYGKITILLEILAGFQCSPLGHTPNLSILKGLTTLSPNSWFCNKQIMNPSCTAAFVTNLPSIMSTVVTTTLHGIPMTGIRLAMILIKAFSEWLPNAPEQLQDPQISSRTTFANPVTIQNSTRTSRVNQQATIHCTVQNAMQNYYLEKQGDKTLFINSDQLLFTQQCPDRIIEVTIAFG